MPSSNSTSYRMEWESTVVVCPCYSFGLNSFNIFKYLYQTAMFSRRHAFQVFISIALLFPIKADLTTPWPDYEIVIDKKEDLTYEWNDYACFGYQEHYKDFASCPVQILGDPSALVGFWASCSMSSCLIKYSHMHTSKVPPSTLEIRSYLEGDGQIDVSLFDSYTTKMVGSINESYWVESTFDLRPFELDGLPFVSFLHGRTMETIYINSYSTNPPNDVDLIDTIKLKYSSSLPSTTYPITDPITTHETTTESTTTYETTTESGTTHETTTESATTHETTTESGTTHETPTESGTTYETTTELATTYETTEFATTYETTTESATTYETTESATTYKTTTESATTYETTRTTESTKPTTTHDPTRTTESTIITTTPKTTEMTSTLGYCGIHCTGTDRYNISWMGCAGETTYEPCPNSNGSATWFCQLNGIFNGPTPDFTLCKSGWIDEIEKEIEGGVPIPEGKATSLLDAITTKTEENTYFGHEIIRILEMSSRILSQISKADLSNFEILTDNTWQIFESILSTRETWNELSTETRSKTGTTLLSAFEQTALELTERAMHSHLTTAVLLTGDSIFRRSFDNSDKFKLLTGVQVKGNSSLTFPEEYSPHSSHIDMPDNWADYFKLEPFVPFVGFEMNSEEANFIFPVNINKKVLSGPIMGFNFGNRNGTATHPLSFTGKGVRITFRHDLPAWGNEIAHMRRRINESSKAISSTAECVYWDPTELLWSTEGCFVVNSGKDETTCECSHLATFALIMETRNYIGNNYELEFLVLLLLPISMICLIAAMSAKNSSKNGYVLNICGCLLIGNLLVLFAMNKHYFHLKDELCIVSSMLTHYVFLCSIMWTALEGLLTFTLLSFENLNESKQRKSLVLEYVTAYCVPAIIVGSTYSIHALKAGEAFGNDSFCGFNGNFMLEFLGPVTVIIMINLVSLTISLHKAHLISKTNPLDSVRNRATSIFNYIQISLTFSAVAGLTWFFGYIMLIEDSVFANGSAYLFVILLASQGLILRFRVINLPKINIQGENDTSNVTGKASTLWTVPIQYGK